jgi:hypothetical protein
VHGEESEIATKRYRPIADFRKTRLTVANPHPQICKASIGDQQSISIYTVAVLDSTQTDPDTVALGQASPVGPGEPRSFPSPDQRICKASGTADGRTARCSIRVTAVQPFSRRATLK